MLVASDEIDLNLSLPACFQGHDFISVSNTLVVINLFSNIFFLSNSFNKKKMNGRTKLFGKKGWVPMLV